MLITSVLAQEKYLIAGLLGAAILINIGSSKTLEWTVALLFIGEICSIAAAYVLIWLFIPIQCAIIGLFLSHLQMLEGALEIRFLLLLFLFIPLITYGIEQINHMMTPVILLISGIGLFLLYAHISEYRLRKEYSGDS